jgi:hypothetical protein
MSNSYAKQKLYEAVHCLVGSNTIQERLTFAAVSLVQLRAPVGELPSEIREQFDVVLERLTIEPLSTATGYSPRRLTDEEGREIAQDIFGMFVKVMGGL